MDLYSIFNTFVHTILLKLIWDGAETGKILIIFQAVSDAQTFWESKKENSHSFYFRKHNMQSIFTDAVV